MADTENGSADAGPLTNEEAEIIKVTWEKIAEDKKSNGVKLFIILFTQFPHTKDMFRLFRGVPLDDLKYHGETTKKNRRMVAHAMSVMYAIESFVDSLDDLDCLIELVAKTARTHLKQDVGHEQFMYLVPVFNELIDEAITDENIAYIEMAKATWEKLLTVVADLVRVESTQDTLP